MNCENCGAPTELSDGLNMFRCQFCESTRFVGELEQTEEGIASLEVSAEINCPSCEVDMTRGLIDKIPVAFCGDCHGMLIHAPSFAKLIREKRQKYKGPDDEPIKVDQQAMEIQRKCPICQNAFETYPYYGPGNCVIDSCRPCEMTWFDRGELSQIIRAPGYRGEPPINPIESESVKPKNPLMDSPLFFEVSDSFGWSSFGGVLSDIFDI